LREYGRCHSGPVKNRNCNLPKHALCAPVDGHARSFERGFIEVRIAKFGKAVGKVRQWFGGGIVTPETS
jgi:hypothetical protein